MNQISAAAEPVTDGPGLDGAERMIAESFARRAPQSPELAFALGAGLQMLRSRGFVAAPVNWLQEAAAELGLKLDPAEWAPHRLQTCPLIGPPASDSHLVWDQQLLYFRIEYEREQQLTRWLVARLHRELDCPQTAIRALESIEGLDASQLSAVTAAASRALTVISGGPGTGKTTTVAALIAALLTAGHKPGDIAVAAPTGKAAARINHALGAALGRYLPGADPPQAATLHRLLRWRPQQAGFEYGPERKLPHQVVIVDEVSMVDLHLMHALVGAVDDDARLVLVGDKDQLVSVQPGSVLADLYAGLGDTAGLCTLTSNYRFGSGSGIGRLAAAIRDGRLEEALDAIEQGGQALSLRATIEDIDAEISKFRVALQCREPEAAWRGLGAIRWVCAHRRGAYGSEGLNRRVISALDLPPPSGAPVQPGTLFAVTGNHYSLGFFNGDQGFIPLNEDPPRALVELADGSLRALSPLRLPEVEPAFAMTVHRAQGSEFDEVVVILPPADSPVLTRQWLYTAVTRARQRLHLVGSEGAIRAAIAQPSRRGSGLAQRLREQVKGVTADR